MHRLRQEEIMGSKKQTRAVATFVLELRESYYQYYWQQETTSFEEELVIREVLRIRQTHRRMGGRKLYELLEPFMLEHQIKIAQVIS